MLSFVYAVLYIPSFNILSVFFFYRLLSLGAVPMHCLNSINFVTASSMKLIKRENLAKAKNRTSKLKTTRVCTHNL